MADNMTFVGMINIEEYVRIIEKQLNDVIKNSTYSELSKYIELLPPIYASEQDLFSWGVSYLNEYYKVLGKLDKIHTPEIEQLKYKIYILYLKENYNKVILSFEEFITFSRLLNIAFSEYNPNKVRERDRKPYQSGDETMDFIVNKIAHNVLHSPKPHAYEVVSFKLRMLLNVLNDKRKALLGEAFSNIDLDDDLLNGVLSEERINELKKKRN